MENNNSPVVQEKPKTITSLLSAESVKTRFQEILGNKSAGFISSIISATKANASLAKCDPGSIISSAVIAATLDLPIQQNLGFAWIIPYNNKAEFQMGYKGYIQLAMRSGQYKTMNVCEVCEGELISEDKFKGEFLFDSSKKTSDKVIGYAAYFKLINGFEKVLYMPIENIEKHAKRYSQTYKKGFGKWKDDFDAMARKTVIKLLLSKYGIMTVDMQTAIITDQSVVKDAETLDVEYMDNEEPPINKEEERLSLMISDATTVEDLQKLWDNIPDSLNDMFHAKMEELKLSISQANTDTNGNGHVEDFSPSRAYKKGEKFKYNDKVVTVSSDSEYPGK